MLFGSQRQRIGIVVVNKEPSASGEGLFQSWLPDLEPPRTLAVLDRFPIGLVKNHRGRLDIVAPFASALR